MSNRYVGGVITEKVNVAQAPWSGAWTEQAQLQAKAQGTWAPLNTQIGNSLRFRSSASAYLSRTPAAASNRMTWTWSGWVKRGALGTQQFLFDGRSTASTNPHTWISFSTTDALLVGTYDTADTIQLITSQVFRDPSAWYHIVCVLDTTQATAANRVKLFINGAQVTAFSTATYPPQNFQAYVNAAQAHSIGAGVAGAAGTLFDGYMAEINFIDGQALTPAAFGMFDAASGVWKPTVYGGTYGTNGFKLNFSNGTSTTTLGYDSSGNSNNWTTNNISLTAGTTYDWMLDSPTPLVGTSYGVGNYAVLNPLNYNPGGTPSGANSLQEGNLYLPFISGAYYSGFNSTIAPSSGKWYVEATTITGGAGGGGGLALAYPGSTNNIGAINSQNYAVGSTLAIAFDCDAGTGTRYVNNSSIGTFTFNAGVPIHVLAYTGNALGLKLNFGQRPFAYSPPTGFKSLCTFNLPAPAIANGANYMAATTYTGTSTSRAVSNLVYNASFQPDFVWAKQRGAATDHVLYDSIRTGTYSLTSNNTAAEVNRTSNGCTVNFNTGGFTAGADIFGVLNYTGRTYVAWQWKAGGTAVSNTNGSITSSVSASALSGFSVVTYTGNGTAGATVGHGLGVAPSFIVTKTRSSVMDWYVYHVSLGVSQYLALNSTIAAGASTNYWGSTSSTFALSAGGNNVSGSTMVAYCFAAIAGYSAFGSYTGNGSADGPFVYCGFRPRWVLVKLTSAAGSAWTLLDTSRSTYNVTDNVLRPDTAGAEFSGNNTMDILSNGFKLRTTWGDANTSSATYIYAAFAENPFQNALAR